MTQLIVAISLWGIIFYRRDSTTHMHGLAVDVKEGLSFARDLCLENSANSYLCFRIALFHLVLFLYQSLSLCMVFDSISSNIDEFLSINPSANVLLFGDFDVQHKNWLTYSGGTDQLVNSVIVFLSQMVNFPTRIADSHSHSSVLLGLFFPLKLISALQQLSLHWGNLIILLSQFPLILHQIHDGVPCFIA